MESKVNYTLVGLFVLILVTAGILIPLWLSATLNRKEYCTYEVFMDESVDGLSENAAVKYNGVDVGYVKAITLNPNNTQQVELLLNIQEGTPITTNTTAVMRMQGITGVAYIGLQGGSNVNAQPLGAQSGQEYPVIKSAPSILLRLEDAITQSMNSIKSITNSVNGVLTPQNQRSIAQTLQHLDQVTTALANNTAQINNSIKSITTLSQNLSQSSQNMPATMSQIQVILNNLQSITEEIKQNPTIVLRGKSNPPLGPGEK